VLSPDGKDWLTGAGRSPGSVFGAGRTTLDMQAIARKYPVKYDPAKAIVQDFHSISQALNVASADQRLLVLLAGPEKKLAAARTSIGPVINHQNNVGRFHVDSDTGAKWPAVIAGEKSREGIFFIAAGEFGLKGRVLKQLPLDASQAAIYEALVTSNKTYAASTRKKDYGTHVDKGHRLGIRYENVMPFGEDRDGDGKIDNVGGPRRSRFRE